MASAHHPEANNVRPTPASRDDGTVEDGSPEEFAFENESHRRAGYLELTRLAYIASCDWQLFWNGKLGSSLKAPLMNTIFFHYFALAVFQTSSTITVLTGDQPWLFHLIVECETISDEKERFHKFTPRSDLLVSKSNLPRLLVVVNSKPKTDWPSDLVRMLLTGAAIVRFANKSLNTFIAEKNFVLIAIYIWEDGKVSRYLMFQEPDNRGVRYEQTSFSLNSSVGRAEFARQLHNFRDMLESEKEVGDTKEKVQQFQTEIQRFQERIDQQRGVVVDNGGGRWEPLLDKSGRKL